MTAKPSTLRAKIHLVHRWQQVGGQFACGDWPFENMFDRVTLFKRSVTCRRCRKILGLTAKKGKRK